MNQLKIFRHTLKDCTWGAISFLCLLGMLTSCGYIDQLKNLGSSDEVSEEPIARAKGRYLYQRDMNGLVPPRSSAEDSANLVRRYVDSWIRKQLLMLEAEERLEMDEAEINRRIEDYRYDLLVYAYEKQFLEEHLDTAVTQQQIEEYYEENKRNFELRQNIVKACFLKIPKEAQRLGRVKRWMKGVVQVKDLQEYAYGYATDYHLNDSIWVDYDGLIAGSPFVEEISNEMRLFRQKSFVEASDSTHQYYLRILDYKLSSDISPLEFVEDQIRDIIINSRRVGLRRDHERDILNRAEKNEDYEIFE